MSSTQENEIPFQLQWTKILSGSCLVAGTAIGAGMLGIPLRSGSAGFMPACLVTLAVWFFMLCSGLILLEVALWMPLGSNILSMSKRFLGKKGEWISGIMFLFLYYCLIVAYTAAGGPMFAGFLESYTGISLSTTSSFVIFNLIMCSVVYLGAVWIDRTNMILSVGMVLAFVMMLGSGGSAISMEKLQFANYSKMFYMVPILFGAFGFHNVIPSLCTYYKQDKRLLQLSIFIGTIIALLVYLIWQYLIIGSVSHQVMQETLLSGQTAIHALESVTGNHLLFQIARYFAFFALTTSMLGVSFSMVDFFTDGFSTSKWQPSRLLLCLVIFVPAIFASVYNPNIFDRALGVAGGIGEAFLNGILPVCLVWVGRYHCNIFGTYRFPGGKVFFIIMLFFGILVMLYEGYHVMF